MTPIRPAPQRRHQTGFRQSGSVGVFALVLLAVALATAGWWWQRTQAQTTAASKDGPASPAGAASGPPAGAAGGGNSGGGRRGPGADRPQPVSVGVVNRQNVREIVNAIGSVTAFNSVVVRPRVEGELKSIHFKEGEQVKAGQLLAEIDPRPFQVALAQAQGQLAKDQAQVRNAQVDLKRYKALLAKDSIARQQVDTQDALVRQLQGSIAVDQAAVDSAKLQLSYTKVTAPIGGRLGLRQVDVGNVVRASDANGIVSITQTRPISVTFAVPESKVAQITRQLRGADRTSDPDAGPALPVELWDREQRNKLATGRVTATDNMVDAATGTIKLRARFANDDDMLFPNQFVNVRLTIDVQDDAVVVPTNAVQRGSQGTYVYKVQDDSTVTVRKVELGVTDGDWISVKGDLAAGDKVVTDGADRLREGAKVDAIMPGPEGATQAAAVTDGRPAWMDGLPPEMVEKVKAMSPDERHTFLRKFREKDGRDGGGSVAGGG